MVEGLVADQAAVLLLVDVRAPVLQQILASWKAGPTLTAPELPLPPVRHGVLEQALIGVEDFVAHLAFVATGTFPDAFEVSAAACRLRTVAPGSRFKLIVGRSWSSWNSWWLFLNDPYEPRA